MWTTFFEMRTGSTAWWLNNSSLCAHWLWAGARRAGESRIVLLARQGFSFQFYEYMMFKLKLSLLLAWLHTINTEAEEDFLCQCWTVLIFRTSPQWYHPLCNNCVLYVYDTFFCSEATLKPKRSPWTCHRTYPARCQRRGRWISFKTGPFLWSSQWKILQDSCHNQKIVSSSHLCNDLWWSLATVQL